ncbi:MCE family protein [Seonamhaeicola sediminis]|uniref:MCE family protein n=1 Tax=Seonamhaeicola sediminis TaxID=2528206 RepID=A0A562YEQ2_9FLAO|nr:MlaD family protein [Seonamhaeicola sediminis]TWO33060.1 MCE family protein [Seonamhaeicola sediminis]
MKISKEVKTAVLVLSGIVLLIFGYNYLKGQNLLDSSRIFYTEYDNVEGLTPSMPVTISGKIVGKVSNISFKGDGSANLIVELLVDSDFQFSKTSKAELYETGLIGGKAIAIVPAFDNAANAQSGDTLEGSVQAGLSELVNQKLTPLQENLESMLDSADALLKNLNTLFDSNTKANLKSSISGLSETISEFKVTAKSLNDILVDDESNLNKTLANVEEVSANFSKVSDSLANANIGQTIRSLESTLNNFNSILVNMESGEGSMGKLLKDDALYNNLEGATGELEELLRDIKLHPKRYFRILSKKEIPYSEEENN